MLFFSSGTNPTMYSRVLLPPRRLSQRSHDPRGRFLIPLFLWICVSVSLRYGYYGDCRMVLGPSSSRLMRASSVFVEQVEVRDGDKKGCLLYGFSERPQLGPETNWSVTKYMVVSYHSRKGFALWLNQGSRIRMSWEAQSRALDQLQIIMVKGERKTETLEPILTSSSEYLNLSAPLNSKQAEYMIDEDDKYYLGVISSNPSSVVMIVTVNVTSRMYDLSKGTHTCSTTNGSCLIKLSFPYVHYVVLTTSNNGDLGGSFIELSFLARIVTYVALLGFIIIIIFLVLKYLGACDTDSNNFVDVAASEVSETAPIPQKPIPFTYGTNKEEDDDDGSSSSSEDLYDAKLCVICYDDQRNCFFVPCGHCATCYDCAQRIMEEDSKVCPICRKLVHKVRRLFSP